MPLRAVVFDLFDTLVDLHMDGLPLVSVGGRSFPSTAGLLHAELARHAPEVSLEAFASAQRVVDREVRAPRYEAGRELPTRERFDFVLAGLGVERAGLSERLTQLHMELLRSQVRALAHHGELLARLRQRARLAVCSNFTHSQTALAVLEEAGLRWHFDAVVVSDAVGFRKPRAEIFHATLAALGSAPHETLHVGDNLAADIAGAAALGVRTAWITRRVPKADEALARHAGPRPDHVVSDLAEIVAIAERA